MFGYYGTKRSIAHYYPEPLYDTIVEPFCGAAGYSLHGLRWRKQVRLFDVDPSVVAAWDFLIHANYKDIIELPILKPGETVSNIDGLEHGARCFLGFMISASPATVKNTATVKTRWTKTKRRWAADRVWKVNHWTIENLNFRALRLGYRVSWFVDPPYEQDKNNYRFGMTAADYYALGLAVREWQGQLIVCEGDGVTWIDAKPLVSIQGQGSVDRPGRKSTEYLYYRED